MGTDTQLVGSPQGPEDWFLQFLVKVSNQELEVGVTLQMGGILVSGVMIGPEAYINGFVDTLAAFCAPDNPAAQADWQERFSEIKKVAQLDSLVDAEGVPSRPQYIHLRDPRFIDAKGNIFRGVGSRYWRGRLTQIDAFMLGVIGAEAP